MSERAPSPRPVDAPLGLAFTSLLRADILVLLRGRVSGIATLLVPVILIVVTSFGKRATALGGYEVLIGLAITVGLATSGLLGYSMELATDRDSGVLTRLRTTPTSTWALMVSRLLVHVIADLIMAIVVVILGAIIYKLSLSAGEVLGVLAVAVLGAAVFLAIGQLLVGLLNSVGAVNAVGRILLIALILLGLMGATGVLGDTMKSVADWTPIGALMTIFTDVFRASWDAQSFGALAACAGYIIVCAFVGIRWFRWDARP